MLVQDVVVLGGDPQGQRSGLLAAVEEYRGARYPQHRRAACVQVVDERPQGALIVLASRSDQRPSALPGGQHGE
ncbi:MAG TPA: hypothetical protein VES60_15240, partial [Nakamurella sp.]|nr:hypothetical protein [Nakamurella sp.]